MTQLIFLPTTPSTNDHAKDLALHRQAPEFTCVYALEQTKGRGSRQREWISPKGNLYASYILYPDCPPQTAPQLSFVTALAIRAAIVDIGVAGEDITLKWPNDVLLNNKKLAGILLESSAQTPTKTDYVVAGVGVNLINHPENVLFPATDIKTATGITKTPADMAPQIQARIQQYEQQWKNQGFAPIRQEWLTHAAQLNQPITIKLHNETVSGIFTGLDEQGNLILQMEGGKTRLMNTGDIFPANGR